MSENNRQGEGQLRNKTMGNMLWRFAERCGAQGVMLVVSVVLARLLDPDVYGTVALITVFTTILQVFVDSGLGNALIQKKDADQLDFSTVFYFNMAMCAVVYAALYIAAPFIAKFYGDPQLTALTRVLGLTLIVSSLRNIQQAYVSRQLMFKKFFYSAIGGTVFSAIVGIAMAYMGFGVWALVAQQLTNVTAGTVILFFTVRWRPSRMFSLERFKGLFAFGWKLLVSALLDTVYGNIRQLIIGKFYSNSDLAFYNEGEKYPRFLSANINSSIDSVLLPVMSNVQDNRERVRDMTRRAIKTGVYVMAPLMMGLAFTAPTVVELLLTRKWIDCVPFMRVFCTVYMFESIHTANLNAIKAMGRSDLFLKLEIAKKAVGLTTLIIVARYGVMAMVYSLLFTSFACQLINAWPNRKLLNYSYLEQMKDILPSILLAVVMGACTLPIALLELPNILTLALQVLVGVGVYVGGSVLLKLESFQYLWSMVKPFVLKVAKRR